MFVNRKFDKKSEYFFIEIKIERMRVKMSFGETVREVMSEKGIKQNELAREIGMSSSGISTALRDDSNPRLDTIRAISSALGVPIHDLVREKAQKKGPAVAGPTEAVTRLFDEIQEAGLSDAEADFLRAQIAGIKAHRRPR